MKLNDEEMKLFEIVERGPGVKREPISYKIKKRRRRSRLQRKLGVDLEEATLTTSTIREGEEGQRPSVDLVFLILPFSLNLIEPRRFSPDHIRI